MWLKQLSVDTLFTECTRRKDQPESVRQTSGAWSTELIRQFISTIHFYQCLFTVIYNKFVHFECSVAHEQWSPQRQLSVARLHFPPLCCFMQCWEVCTCNTVVLSELRGSAASSPRLTNCLSLCLLLNVSSQHICIVLCSRVLLKCPLAFILRCSLLFFPLIYARWSYLTWFYFLTRVPRRPRC